MYARTLYILVRITTRFIFPFCSKFLLIDKGTLPFTSGSFFKKEPCSFRFYFLNALL